MAEPHRVRVSSTTRERLEALPSSERGRVLMLLESARSPVQRELLERALQAGRRGVELRAFAEAIRPLPDAELLDACFRPGQGPADAFMDRLRAEADPVHGFLARGQAEESQSQQSLQDTRAAEPSGHGPPRAGAGVARTGAAPSEERPAPRTFPVEELLNPEVRPFGLRYGQQVVDAGGLTLEAALEQAGAALEAGYPVPVLLGRAVGDLREVALLLQSAGSGKRRTFQLHQPAGELTLWLPEAALLGRRELPPLPAEQRRITAVMLPSFRHGRS